MIHRLFIATSVAAIAALFTGCGRSQPPIGAPGAMPQTSALAIASLLIEIGLAQQKMAHDLSDPRVIPSVAEANHDSIPRLTPDVALSLIDDRLTAAGGTNGVTRDEIDAAFNWLTSPLVNRAVWGDAERTFIVILTPWDA